MGVHIILGMICWLLVATMTSACIWQTWEQASIILQEQYVANLFVIALSGGLVNVCSKPVELLTVHTAKLTTWPSCHMTACAIRVSRDGLCNQGLT
jgi:hypothetical protein